MFSWLVAGSERCVLVDTGLGLADIAAAIEPVAAATIVVNSHVHFDHVGGNELFDHVEMHELARWIEFATRTRKSVATGGRGGDAQGWNAYRSGPRRLVLDRPRRDDAAVAVSGSPSSGGGSIAAAHPPAGGRGYGLSLGIGPFASSTPATPDHLPPRRGRGDPGRQDQRTTGRCWSTSRAPIPATYACSARRLADELAGDPDRLHGAQPAPVDCRDSSASADAAEAVAAGEARLSPARGCSASVLGADFGHFSILVSPEFAP